MISAEVGRELRMTQADRSCAGLFSVLDFFPLDLPSLDQLRAAFFALAISPGYERLGWAVSRASRWRTEQGLGAIDDGLVFQVVPAREPDPVRWLRARLRPELPVQFGVQHRRRLVAVVDHRLGDGLLTSLLPLLLLRAAQGRIDPPPFSTQAARPLVAAARHHWGLRPRAWRALLDERDSPEHQVEVAPTSLPDPLPVPKQAEMASNHMVLDADGLRRLRAWAGGTIAFGPAVTVVLAAALRAVGVPVRSSAELVIDLRRYLPSGMGTFANFVAGLDVPLIQPSSGAARLNARVSHELDLGLPLARAVSGALRPPITRPPRAPLPAQGVGLSVSSLGRLRSFELLPWSAPPSARHAAAHVMSSWDASISVIAFVMDAQLHLSAVYPPQLVDADQLSSAAQMVSDHFSHLTASVGSGRG